MIKQKGFTLLELLVVITLLAILAVGGLVAYDGVTDNAETSAAAYNAGTLDRAVRQFRAVTNRYPDQWDNLANPLVADASAGSDATDTDSDDNDQFMPLLTRQIFSSISVSGLPADVRGAIFNAVDNVWGMEELQHIGASGLDPNVVPGKQHNEGSNLGAVETVFEDGFALEDGTATGFDFISILPTAKLNAGAGCTIGGVAVAGLSTPWRIDATDPLFDGSPAVVARRANAINDALSANRCNLVIALGFGGDAASSTAQASVNIPAAPTYSSPGVDVTRNYGRYVGLFHMARGDDDVAAVDIEIGDFLPRPKLIGFVTTEGDPVDVNVARSRDPIND